METVQRQKELVNGSIAILFQVWEEQLRDKTKECDLLRQEVQTLQRAISTKDVESARLEEENTLLKEEATTLRVTSGFVDSTRLEALIEKHNDLYKEHERLKVTAAANQHDLIKQLRKEREKLRSWNNFSSPGPGSPQLAATRTFDTSLNRLHAKDRSNARGNRSESRDHAGGLAHAQGNVSLQQIGPVPAESELPPNGSEERRSLDKLAEADSSITWKGSQASSESQLTKQPPDATDFESSFVDAHLRNEPRILSPELPSIQRKHQRGFHSDRDSSTGIERAPSRGSLPQIQRSDSTAPPSEGPATGAIEQAPADDVPSSDTPEFLGARSVKKRAARDVASHGDIPAGNANEPVTIKSDPDTSFVMDKPPQFTRQESSIHESLDPSASRVEARSPRKHRPRPLLTTAPLEENVPQNRADLETMASQRAASEPTSFKEPISLVDQPNNSRAAVNINARQATPLRRIDGNIRRGLKKADLSSDLKSRKRKHEDSRGVEAIPTIAEDGEEFTTKTRRTSTNRGCSPRLVGPGVHRRLDSLLTRPPASRECLPQISRKTTEEMDRSLSLATLNKTLGRETPFNELLRSEEKDWEWWDEAQELLTKHKGRAPETSAVHPRWHHYKQQDRIIDNASTPNDSAQEHTRTPHHTWSSISSPALSSAHETTNPTPSHPPYRTLPPSSLNPTHFKLNPAANHNLSYAYTSVVRNQSERKRLPGCTRPECCGRQFAALAQTLPPTTTTTTTTNRSPTPTLTAEDEAALKSYLGAARYEGLDRAPSPPGFWNVDFPATQEREEDRMEAERREREEVKARWREAMKNPDPRVKGKGDGSGSESGSGIGKGEMGLWMFADE
ncbi:hypothetical protein EPUS_08463 [Endocarpon pusillum Z07020]|uniref:DNA endonuclease activator Ctp1 C-terminal domain-containing protein n=1 Tax=Endocarpon pusillum (strain Z07020 / HMAS-L-300199) TaxID=1263415 RepID=U1I4W8_ENDPU|nr:uncharacterized protein EPUS_08463 [Endocarpon pusillum Z07020]ERF77159.1 hypothetical protein EPUS_08463 [Endocarpon pusillum Z07020]